MAMRFQRSSQKENNPAMSKQRKGPSGRGEAAPDLTDFMNDRFFGAAAKMEQHAYNLTGESAKREGVVDGGGSRSKTSMLTQEWLEEARRIVSVSPVRHDSPVPRAGSPRFVASQASETLRAVERRDPLSRSARRHRGLERISDEILSKSSARNTRAASPADRPAKVLQPPAAADLHQPSDASDGADHPTGALPPKQPIRRRSRFRGESPETQPGAPPKRWFRNSSPAPRNPAAAAEHESQQLLLSPPRNLVESAHRRSISSSTCSSEKLSLGPNAEKGSNRRHSTSTSSDPGDRRPEAAVREDVGQINSFLRRQRAAMEKISSGEVSGKAKIILSSVSSTSTTSSMVAAICYAWLLENKGPGEGGLVVPVVNIQRGRMWNHQQAAWLFHHLGIDASALLFADEVDVEGLLMSRQLNILVIGQDVLKTNGEVGSHCTVLTDNYCEDAYNLLQTPNLKKLLVAGILLDTQNLNSAAKFFTNRDAEAVQLLLVGSAPNYRHDLFEQLMQDHKDDLFLEDLSRNYGKPSNGDNDENGIPQEHRLSSRKPASIAPQEVNMPNSAKQKPATVPSSERAPTPAKAPERTSRGKNKFSWSKLFGFGSK